MCSRPSWEPKGSTRKTESRSHSLRRRLKPRPWRLWPGQRPRGKESRRRKRLTPTVPARVTSAWRTGARSCRKSRTRAHVKCAGAAGIGPETRSVPESKRLRQEALRRRLSRRLCVLRKRELRRTPGTEKSQTPATNPTRDTATSVSRTTWATWPTWDSSTRATLRSRMRS